MTKKKLGVKIALYCSIFALILTVVLGTVGYKTYKNSLIERYEVYTRSLLDTAKSAVEAEGLWDALEMGEENPAYEKARQMLCAIKENSEISYIYVVTFPDAATSREMNFYMNGYTAEDLADDPDYISHIGDPCHLGEVGDEDADFDYAMTQVFWDALYAHPGEETLFYVNDTDVYGYLLTGYEAIVTEAGDKVGVLALDVSMDEIKGHLNNYLFIMAVSALLLLIVFLVVLLSILNRNMIRPITSLAASANDFVSKSENAQTEPENLTFREVSVKTGDEIELLSRSLSNMTRDMKAYMVNLKSVVGEKERISAELDLATNIQASMLPSIFPAFPGRPEIDIYATMHPAREVGGDFYDFFLVDDDHLMVVIADVSGKGVPAALFMVIAKTLIKNNALSGLTPAQVFTSANDQLCENNETGLFVTAWAGLLELSTGRFTFVNAGHNPPVLRRKGGQFEYLRSRPGFVLAGMEDIRYRQTEMTLEPGDVLYLYTDGVTEAADRSDELFGEPRLLASLNALGDVKPEEMLAHVAADVEAFVAGAPQSDDITMLGMKVMSRKASEEEG